ncbi:MAG: DUF4136 domain-containing protein [Acidobacteria bacterium]|nr:DUF4136 domain-containing protein [Acidobacteriota bacterium]
MNHTRLLVVAGLLAGPAMVVAKVHVDLDETADFSRYRTFTIRDGRIRSPHPTLDNSLVQKKLHTAIAAELKKKGLTEATAKADVIVTFSVGSRDRKEVETFPSGGRGRGSRRYVYRVTDSTLVIDLRDPGTKELVWRATCTDTAQDPARLEKKISEDVSKAFKDYPPKKKK